MPAMQINKAPAHVSKSSASSQKIQPMKIAKTTFE
jgi:hypothetical protein